MTATNAHKTAIRRGTVTVGLESNPLPQYSRRRILGTWAAAALPMAALAWIVAPLLHSRLEGPSAWPRAILLCLTVGMIWQFVFVMIAVRREQGTLRWSVLKEALWLRAPRSSRTGRQGGRLWWILVPCILLVAAKEALPKIPAPVDRDQGLFLQSVAGQEFFAGNWLWFTVILTMMIFNTVLGEELLFRGLLLPRMRGAFGRWDWLAASASASTTRCSSSRATARRCTTARDPDAPVVHAIDTSGRAVLFAGGTVVISLLGLFLIGVSFIRGLAVGASLAVLFVMAAAVTLLPAVLGFVGHTIDKFALPSAARSARTSRASGSAGAARSRPARGPSRSGSLLILLILAIAVRLAAPRRRRRRQRPDEVHDPSGVRPAQRGFRARIQRSAAAGEQRRQPGRRRRDEHGSARPSPTTRTSSR